MSRVALVAGGGAIKAYAFHLGVLQGLESDGFHFRSGLRWSPTREPSEADRRQVEIYVGSSAGACVVASLASGHPVEALTAAVRATSNTVPTFGYRVLYVPVAPNPGRYLQRLRRRFRMGQLRPQHLLDVGGLMTTAGVERYFRKHVLATNRFGDLAVELYIAATQVNGARKIVFGARDSLGSAGVYADGRAYYDNVPISQAIAAAVAVPPLFAPYAIVNPGTGERFHYYDGEVREPLSIDVARDAGADAIIVSSIWSPYRYSEQVGTLGDLGAATIVEQALHQAVEQKVQREREVARRHEQVLKLLEQSGVAPDLTQQVRQALHHRWVPTLYVTPADDEDQGFFFEGSFRFNRRLIDRCMAAGRRAYAGAARNNEEFFRQL